MSRFLDFDKIITLTVVYLIHFLYMNNVIILMCGFNQDFGFLVII
jgi:hypothetical protein